MRQIHNVSISKRLQDLRNSKGEREVDISTVLEISPAHYCRLEQGKAKITVDVLQKACTYYGVTAGYILFMEDRGTELPDDAMYKLFMGGLMELIPLEASSAIPTVLEYEKNRRNVSENTMIRELEISRFIWTSIMKNDPIKNIEIPLKIQEQYGYGLDFLINNRIQDSMFLEIQLLQKPLEQQRKIMHTFDQIINMQDRDVEMQG